jgi:hypothetical protein
MRSAIRTIAAAAALLVAAGPGWAQVPPDPELEPVQAWVSDPLVAPEDVVAVHGTGWEPGSQVEIALDGRFLVAAGVDRDGRFSRPVTIPNDVIEGDLTLTVTGTDASGQGTEFPIPLEAQQVGAPGITGGIILAIVFGGLVVLVGLFLLVQRRRRTLTEEVERGHMPVRNPERGKAPQPEDAERGRS